MRRTPVAEAVAVLRQPMWGGDDVMNIHEGMCSFWGADRRQKEARNAVCDGPTTAPPERRRAKGERVSYELGNETLRGMPSTANFEDSTGADTGFWKRGGGGGGGGGDPCNCIGGVSYRCQHQPRCLPVLVQHSN